ncbi:hypothetical protein MGG_16422 [Pyricularia oryzae 70-15]|uniref:Uncharacterized protein n=1 Tax=Pyricularia oryzae (strain 70-15 / ATCC MYA-4617 / FGSC 8958) TaxID=242507 RepID=G4MN70_PYRO7|nr:uncharacterized protein MGG_16422 [Pyricularia oryzae 70-15]EHA57884.1 hypothetical protein MGG_16422 [Pyricularia oryzae 70-15]
MSYTKKTRLWFSSFSCVAVAEGCVESGTVFGGLKKGLFGVARRDDIGPSNRWLLEGMVT